MLINVLGVKLRLIGGYAGSREIMIAMERNEVQGMCGMDWSSFLTQGRDWVSGGFARLLAQEDLGGHPVMNRMSVPLTIAGPLKSRTRVTRSAQRPASQRYGNRLRLRRSMSIMRIRACARLIPILPIGRQN